MLFDTYCGLRAARDEWAGRGRAEPGDVFYLRGRFAGFPMSPLSLPPIFRHYVIRDFSFRPLGETAESPLGPLGRRRVTSLMPVLTGWSYLGASPEGFWGERLLALFPPH